MAAQCQGPIWARFFPHAAASAFLEWLNKSFSPSVYFLSLRGPISEHFNRNGRQDKNSFQMVAFRMQECKEIGDTRRGIWEEERLENCLNLWAPNGSGSARLRNRASFASTKMGQEWPPLGWIKMRVDLGHSLPGMPDILGSMPRTTNKTKKGEVRVLQWTQKRTENLMGTRNGVCVCTVFSPQFLLDTKDGHTSSFSSPALLRV